jgi:hypothetical protein
MLTSPSGAFQRNSNWNQHVHLFQPGARFPRMNLKPLPILVAVTGFLELPALLVGRLLNEDDGNGVGVADGGDWFLIAHDFLLCFRPRDCCLMECARCR